jgi:hypothetical protein
MRTKAWVKVRGMSRRKNVKADSNSSSTPHPQHPPPLPNSFFLFVF